VTRRQRGEGSVYRRRDDGLWVGMVDLGYRDGIRRRKAVYGKTQRQAVKKIAALRQTLATHGTIPASSKSVEAWLLYWLDNIAPRRVKPKTMTTYRSLTTKHLIPRIGRLRLDRLTTRHVRDLITAMEAADLSSSTVVQTYHVLTRALTDAQRDGLLVVNVARNMDPPRAVKREREAFTAGEAHHLIANADGRLASRWVMAAMLGLRQGEVLGLRWSDVNLDDGLLKVQWQLQRLPWVHGCDPTCGKKQGRSCPIRKHQLPRGFEHTPLCGNFALVRPKSKSGVRALEVPPIALASLRARWVAYLTERSGYANDYDLVWPDEKGRPIDAKADGVAWHALLTELDLPQRELHTLRHTTADLLRRYGVADLTAMRTLGQASVDVTRGYQHVDRAEIGAALAVLEERLYEVDA